MLHSCYIHATTPKSTLRGPIAQIYLELPCAEYRDCEMFLGLALGFALGRTGLKQNQLPRYVRPVDKARQLVKSSAGVAVV